MLENVRQRVSGNLQQAKLNPFLIQYLWCLGISILLGICFKYGYDGLVSLIKPSLGTFHISSMSSKVSSIDNSYLFSTSATILSTIFTIIFVLLTIFIQMSGAYTSAEIFRSIDTRYITGLYFSTIILSLMMLEATFQFPIIVLTLTIACILSIYPFLGSISNKLVYGIGIRKLITDIPSQIELKNESLTLDKIESLMNICTQSMRDNRLVEYLSILSIMETNTQKAKQYEMLRVIEIIGYNYLNILNILMEGKLSINRRTMIMSLFGKINAYVYYCSEILNWYKRFLFFETLKETGIRMVKIGFDDEYVNRIVEIFCNSYVLIAKRRLTIDKETTTYPVLEQEIMLYEPDIVHYIGELAKELFNRNSKDSSLTVSLESLFVIAAMEYQVCEHFGCKNSNLLMEVAEQIKLIKELTSNGYLDDIFENLKTFKKSRLGEPTLSAYLDKFKNYYETQYSPW